MAKTPQIDIFPLTGWDYYDPAYLESKDKLCPKMSFTDDYDDPRKSESGQDVKHGAIDLFTSLGTPVLAVCDGIAWPNKELGDTDKEFVYFDRGGWHFYFYGDDGFIYYYSHLLNPPLFKPGQRVRTGVIIGQNGSSGVVYSCPHTHFQVFRTSSEGKKLGAINPYEYLKKAPILDMQTSQQLTVGRLSRLGYALVSLRPVNQAGGPVFVARRKSRAWLWVGGAVAASAGLGYLAWKYL